MSSLIERLRDDSWRLGQWPRVFGLAELEVWDKTCREAAERIEELEEGLAKIQAVNPYSGHHEDLVARTIEGFKALHMKIAQLERDLCVATPG